MTERPVGCSEIRDAFRAGHLPEGPEVSDHVADCESCSELFADEAQLGRALASNEPVPAPEKELWASLERSLTAEVGPRAWLRSRPTRVRGGLLVAAGALGVASAAAKLRPDFATYPALSLATWLALFSLAALAMVRLLLPSPGRPAVADAAKGVALLVALVLPALYALGLMEPVASAVGHDPSFLRHAFGCFSYGAMLSLPVLIVAWSVERHERLPLGNALLAGGLAGLVANLALLFHCPMNERSHLVLGHATIGFVVAIAVAMLSRAGVPRRSSRR